jgi:hypothetical protein
MCVVIERLDPGNLGRNRRVGPQLGTAGAGRWTKHKSRQAQRENEVASFHIALVLNVFHLLKR